MAKLVWDKVGDRRYETGVDRGVLYPSGGVGVPWNGLISVAENPSGGGAQPYYADGRKYINDTAPEEFNGTIEAYTYPDEFAACDGTRSLRPGLLVGQQRRSLFNLSYRTKVGNDTNGVDHAYKIHLVYNALASPTEKSYSTMSDDPEALTFSWEFTTTPVIVGPGFKPTAHITINSARIPKAILTAIEDQLYGTASTAATMPTPAQLLEFFSGSVVLDEFGIEPNAVSGLAQLVFGAGGDLIPHGIDGLYELGSASRLVEIGQPGLNFLED